MKVDESRDQNYIHDENIIQVTCQEKKRRKSETHLAASLQNSFHSSVPSAQPAIGLSHPQAHCSFFSSPSLYSSSAPGASFLSRIKHQARQKLRDKKHAYHSYRIISTIPPLSTTADLEMPEAATPRLQLSLARSSTPE